MNKLKLELETLSVQSFTPSSGYAARGGTVHTHNHTRGHDTCYFSCQLGCTYQESCYNPCATTGTTVP